MATLEGVPLQVLPVNTCGGPQSICASEQYVHVLCRVEYGRAALLEIDEASDPDGEEEYEMQEDLGHPMHSLVGFKIRA